MLFCPKSKSISKQMFEWFIVSSFQFIIFDFVNNDFYETFAR